MRHRFVACHLTAFAALVFLLGCSEGPQASPVAQSDDSAEDAETPFEPSIVYQLAAIHEPALERLKGIAIGPEGRFYLAASTGVVVFDRAWNRVAEFATDGAATAVAVAEDGRVYVSERQKVHVFAADGERLAVWDRPGKARGEFGYLTGIAVKTPDIWLADAGNRVIHRFDTTGDFVAEFGERDDAAGVPGIICPSPYLDCTVGRDGSLYVGNPGRWQVEHYDLNGRLVGHWGRQGMDARGFAGCCNPTNLALLPDGRFVTSEKGSPRVKVLDLDGTLLAMIGGEFFAEHSAGMDLATDGDGRIYVADPGTGKVLVFEQGDMQ